MVPKTGCVFLKKIYIFCFLPQNNIFPFFSQTLKIGWDDGDSDVDGENFLLTNFVENEMAHSQHI